LDAGTATYQLAMGESDLVCLFVHLLQSPSVFAEAKAMMKVTLFDTVREPHWAVLMATMLDLDAQFGRWSYESLAHAISVRQRQDPSAMPATHWDLLMRPDEQGVVFSSFCVRPEDIMPDYGRELVRQFLNERLVARPLARHLRSSGDAHVREFAAMVSEASARLTQINAVRELPAAATTMPVFGEALPLAVPLIPTGIPYVDRFCKGRRTGDCNGVLGAFGAGKTTFAINMAVTEAKNFYMKSLIPGATPELSVLFSYEEPEQKLIRRVWSNAAQIPWDTLEEMTDWHTLSTARSLKQYEHEMFAVAGANTILQGERERYEEAMQWVNRHFVFLDMSGSERYPSAGRGGVAEMSTVLDRLQQERGMKVGTVVADYAGLICRRQMAANNISPDQMRHHLGPLGDRIRQEVAIKYNLTAWIMHQMASDQGKKSATTPLSHLDAAEAHNFAENMALCACLGVVDKRTGCQLLNWSKVRYRKQWEHAPAVLKLDGQFCRFNDVSDRYRPDTVTHTFIDPHTAQTYHGHEQDTGPIGTPAGIAPLSADPEMEG
jgi:hypothetical protein